MIPTKEQIQWLWEQCGFYRDSKTYHFDMTEKVADWYCPDGSLSYGGGSWKGRLPNPDINNLFEHAVPKLFNKGLDIYLFSDDGYYFAYTVTNDLEHKRCFDSIVGTEDPAIALFSTIYKALGGKEWKL